MLVFDLICARRQETSPIAAAFGISSTRIAFQELAEGAGELTSHCQQSNLWFRDLCGFNDLPEINGHLAIVEEESIEPQVDRSTGRGIEKRLLGYGCGF
jgi:hypothetical protein